MRFVSQVINCTFARPFLLRANLLHATHSHPPSLRRSTVCPLSSLASRLLGFLFILTIPSFSLRLKNHSAAMATRFSIFMACLLLASHNFARSPASAICLHNSLTANTMSGELVCLEVIAVRHPFCRGAVALTLVDS